MEVRPVPVPEVRRVPAPVPKIVGVAPAEGGFTIIGIFIAGFVIGIFVGWALAKYSQPSTQPATQR